MNSSFLYIITNVDNTILYIGVSSNLSKKMVQHQNKSYQLAFAARFDLYKLVYWKAFSSNSDAADFHKELKAAPLEAKEVLIEAMNPHWEDLSEYFPEDVLSSE